MEETVTLKPSGLQLAGLSGIYLFVLVAGLSLIQSLPYLLLFGFVLSVFFHDDWSRYRRDYLQFRLRSDGSVLVWQFNTETCYPECRMYYNRWCMVIKLKNHEHTRSLVLTADRFADVKAFAAARHHLLRFEERCRVA